jgi:hypothetical protein
VEYLAAAAPSRTIISTSLLLGQRYDRVSFPERRQYHSPWVKPTDRKLKMPRDPEGVEPGPFGTKPRSTPSGLRFTSAVRVNVLVFNKIAQILAKYMCFHIYSGFFTEFLHRSFVFIYIPASFAQFSEIFFTSPSDGRLFSQLGKPISRLFVPRDPCQGQDRK